MKSSLASAMILLTCAMPFEGAFAQTHAANISTGKITAEQERVETYRMGTTLSGSQFLTEWLQNPENIDSARGAAIAEARKDRNHTFHLMALGVALLGAALWLCMLVWRHRSRLANGGEDVLVVTGTALLKTYRAVQVRIKRIRDRVIERAE